jgi:kumamolisin
LYNFPDDLDGADQSIALIELNSLDSDGNINGTGYIASDLEEFFTKMGRPVPEISIVSVAGGANKPGLAQAGDNEVTMDICIIGAVAPKAKISVYFAPNTDAGFLAAVSAAIHDPQTKPTVISISWVSSEDRATDQFLHGLDSYFQDAAAVGVTVCCATGDFGSSGDFVNDGEAHVGFPASSPFALACGGSDVTIQGASIAEVVWNDGPIVGATGGGISNKFSRPLYQNELQIPLSPKGVRGRGLPDVCSNAAHYEVIVKGSAVPFEGTSAAAPLWAGLIALINQRLYSQGSKPVGFLNPLIYQMRTAIDPPLKDVIEGKNDIDGMLGRYAAQPGWDACTGLGSPRGKRLLELLSGAVDRDGARDR